MYPLYTHKSTLTHHTLHNHTLHTLHTHHIHHHTHHTDHTHHTHHTHRTHTHTHAYTHTQHPWAERARGDMRSGKCILAYGPMERIEEVCVCECVC
jgi:hypothetical protein